MLYVPLLLVMVTGFDELPSVRSVLLTSPNSSLPSVSSTSTTEGGDDIEPAKERGDDVKSTTDEGGDTKSGTDERGDKSAPRKTQIKFS